MGSSRNQHLKLFMIRGEGKKQEQFDSAGVRKKERRGRGRRKKKGIMNGVERKRENGETPRSSLSPSLSFPDFFLLPLFFFSSLSLFLLPTFFPPLVPFLFLERSTLNRLVAGFSSFLPFPFLSLNFFPLNFFCPSSPRRGEESVDFRSGSDFFFISL